MGQRHQAFLIARVVPHGGTQPKFRCIAAYHHQWCYGTLPLRAVRRCLTLIKQKENADDIREEIRAIDGKYGPYRGTPPIPDVPCPFTAALLGMSWNINLSADEPYFSGIKIEDDILPASMGCWDGDNNDGITIIDVTDPENPAYCFVTRSTPLDGVGYIRHYYGIPVVSESKPLEGIEFGIIKSLLGLEGERLLSLEALAGAWPPEYPFQRKKVLQEKPVRMKEDEHQVHGGQLQATSPLVPSLTDITLHSAVLHSIQTGSNSGALADMLWLPGRVEVVKGILRQQSPFPTTGIKLLERLIEHESDQSTLLDLSFFDISDDQLLEVVKERRTSITQANLSCIPRLTASAIQGILQVFPNIKRLVVMNCSSVSSEDIHELLISRPQLFFKLEAFIHPALFPSPLDEHTFEPIITLLWKLTPSFFTHEIALPFISPANIVQRVTDFFQVIDADYGSWKGMTTAFSAAARPPGKSWCERTVVAMPKGFGSLISYRRDMKFGEQTSNNHTEKIFACEGAGDVNKPSTAAYGGMYEPEDDVDACKQTNTHPSIEHDAAAECVEVGIGDILLSKPKGIQGQSESTSWRYEVHDLRGFLQAIIREGGPKVPEEAVIRAEENIQKVSEEYPLMGKERVAQILPTIFDEPERRR